MANNNPQITKEIAINKQRKEAFSYKISCPQDCRYILSLIGFNIFLTC